jgi:hypothetical protein
MVNALSATVFKNMVAAIAVLWLYSGIDGLAAQAVLGGFHAAVLSLVGGRGVSSAAGAREVQLLGKGSNEAVV